MKHMFKSKKLIVTVGVILVVVVLAGLIMHSYHNTHSGILTVGPGQHKSGSSSFSTKGSNLTPATKASSSETSLNAPRTTQPAATVAVSVDETGFHPEAVYVASGATVTWTNTGTQAHQIAPSLNPYATSQPLAGMKSPLLKPGQSFSFTITYDMTESGSAGYYDASMTTHKGDIAVAQP